MCNNLKCTKNNILKHEPKKRKLLIGNSDTLTPVSTILIFTSARLTLANLIKEGIRVNPYAFPYLEQLFLFWSSPAPPAISPPCLQSSKVRNGAKVRVRSPYPNQGRCWGGSPEICLLSARNRGVLM